VKFALIGPHMDDSVDYLRRLAPSNVEFIGYASDEELVRWYQRAKVYCQLSYEEGEGAGGALGEAMGCECVPVVSEKAVALKETVASYGFYVPYGDVKATAKAIGLALQAPTEIGANVRKRIKEFSLERREHALVKLVEALT
jgi:glycosyltransferase involved in cell wall biosynthesis